MQHPHNPTRPSESPIKVTNSGGWTPNQYRHETAKPQTQGIQPVKGIVVHESTEQINSNTKVKRTKLVDPNLADAIDKDLKSRNLKK